ncbi:hypothetical protein [Crocosphaera sp. XPORK-15E]|uniref:hypothetical protein n=1 Tax=Crocosphaera sp. XPORK-15E TaxID=3110247 RepID=UPI002B1F64B8|nr:hypothetical protein [Crocosphaera sp. XPORK-15E]MEA5532393.1 hypothetical protein [Crocosphaera sp. XPORK-15E]
MNGEFNGHRSRGAIPHLSLSNYQAENDGIYKQMRYLSLCHPDDGLIQTKKQIIGAGQLGTHSTYSIINPGALYQDQKFQLLCRGEPDETVWFGDFLVHQASPLWCILDDNLNIKESFLLHYPELPPNSRPEDWRLFEYQGKLYTNHSIYMMLDREQWIVRSRPGISEIDLQNRTLTLRWILEPPFEASSEEKNWSFFVHEDSLMCVYSFKPYVILEIDLERGRTYKILEAEPNYQWYDKGKFVGNSTNLVSWNEDHYIMFVHDFLEPKHEQRNRAYMQYGTLISKRTLLPTSIIPRPLIIGGDEPGRHPGVHYTSALVNREDGLYGFYGQGDTHTGIVVFNKDYLNGLFDQYQLNKNKNKQLGIMKGLDSRKGIIVSYPASGFNWVRYCIEYFTGLRTAGKTKLIEDGELAVYRTHYVKYAAEVDSCFCPFYDDQGKPLHRKVVLILRDYRESFIRAAKGKDITDLSVEKIRSGDVFEFEEYFENLKAYDEFSGKKLLVYYPEIVSDLSGITKILDFLELPYDLSNFDLEYHRQQSIKIYDTQHTSHTQNNIYDFSFHQNEADPEIIKAIDEFFSKNYGDLINRYLR